MTARELYNKLTGQRAQFLTTAREASRLTLPYLIRYNESLSGSAEVLTTPWQSVGAKGVVTLASKLMLALLPPQTSFFKLQVNDGKVPTTELDPGIRSELDLSFAKVERTIMEGIAASDDRVVVHQAIKHLIVAGNALLFMGKDGMKMYPLNRYVLERDGNGNVTCIVTKESVSKKLLKNFYPDYKEPEPNEVSAGGGLETGYNYGAGDDECEVYTKVYREGNNWKWYQEVDDQELPGTSGRATKDTNPWIPLRFNFVEGEVYGRGRVEEFLGDLKSLEALSQALVEGSAAAAKVVFTVSPSSTTKADTLARAGNGAIIQGRPDDIGVVQVGKTADFRTAYEMAMGLEKRLADAFLIMQVRNSERTTAEEVRLTQLELERQLGGLFSLLTVEFLVPYLNRKLSIAQKAGEIPKLPKNGVVRPAIVAGINAVGRGQDAESLAQFLTTISQTMGPQAIGTLINSEEVVKRLAAAQGIDTLNLVKSMQEVQAERQAMMQQQQQMEMTKQAGQFAQVEQKREEMINADIQEEQAQALGA